ncbi:MAG: 3D domain-containing protein [Phycisphaerales bacterium]
MARTVLEAGAFCAALVVVAQSAVWMKQQGATNARSAASLVALDTTTREPVATVASLAPAPSVSLVREVEAVTPEAQKVDSNIRYFGGRAVRPVKTIWMTVTAYSPDWRSCGEFADGYTATMKSVWTNGGRLVAADPKVLPMGTMISVPGYADGEVVPVLDKGGAIKGRRLDVLYPTHEIARKWGVQKVPVVVWEYVDGGKNDAHKR